MSQQLEEDFERDIVIEEGFVPSEVFDDGMVAGSIDRDDGRHSKLREDLLSTMDEESRIWWMGYSVGYRLGYKG